MALLPVCGFGNVSFSARASAGTHSGSRGAHGCVRALTPRSAAHSEDSHFSGCSHGLPGFTQEAEQLGLDGKRQVDQEGPAQVYRSAWQKSYLQFSGEAASYKFGSGRVAEPKLSLSVFWS